MRHFIFSTTEWSLNSKGRGWKKDSTLHEKADMSHPESTFYGHGQKNPLSFWDLEVPYALWVRFHRIQWLTPPVWYQLV